MKKKQQTKVILKVTLMPDKKYTHMILDVHTNLCIYVCVCMYWTVRE